MPRSAPSALSPLALHDALPIFTGYGSGPDADRPAYDVILQAESGLMSLTGYGEGEPVRVGVAVIDFLSALDRKSTRLNSSHLVTSYAVFCLKKKRQTSGLNCG